MLKCDTNNDHGQSRGVGRAVPAIGNIPIAFMQLHGRRMGRALRPLAMIKQYKYGRHPEIPSVLLIARASFTHPAVLAVSL